MNTNNNKSKNKLKPTTIKCTFTKKGSNAGKGTKSSIVGKIKKSKGK